MSLLVFAAAALTIGAARAQGLSPTPSPAPSGSQSPASVPTSPASAPTPPASPSPTASPVQYRYVTTFPIAVRSLALNDPPQILEIDFNDRELSSGGPLNVRILTSLNVNAVEASVVGRKIGAVPGIEPGHFEVAGALPRIPFVFRGRTYRVRFDAQTVDGRTIRVDVPVFVRR